MKIDKLLVAWAGQDEARTNIYDTVEVKDGFATVTDGHRMVSVPMALMPDATPGLYLASLAGKAWAPSKCAQYPDWQQVMPKKGAARYKQTFEVPAWLASVKKECWVSLHPNGTLEIGTPHTERDRCVYFNAAMLAMLAGETLEIEWNDAYDTIRFELGNGIVGCWMPGRLPEARVERRTVTERIVKAVPAIDNDATVVEPRKLGVAV